MIKKMNEFQIVIPIPSSEYGDCLIVQKYGDAYKLVSGRTIQNGESAGTTVMRWAYPQTGKKGDNRPAEKAIPLQINLGPLKDARMILQEAIDSLPGGAKIESDDSGVPF